MEIKIGSIEFANDYIILLLALIPILIAWYWFRSKTLHNNMQYSSLTPFENVKKSLKLRLRHLPFALRMLSLALLVIAIAQPQSKLSKKDVTIHGIDIIISMDISGSMLAEDFKPNRLEASKDVGIDFINGRPNDRMGLVVFAGESFTQCPLTTDHGVLNNLFAEIKSGMIEDGTAIGDGLATAVNRLKESKAISKVIILLTDGVNNSGAIDPVTAAEIAKVYGIRVYTIGIGSIGKAPYPFQTPFGIQYQNVDVKIDEPLLQNISKTTNGQYFRATDKRKLQEIYTEIDKLEKSKINVSEYSQAKDEFLPFALLAFALFILEFLLKTLIFKTIP